jgi:hypothetical protein
MKPFLRPRQVVELESDKAVLERQLTDPQIEDKGRVRTSIRKVEHQLQSESPPDLNPEQRAKAAKREKELREEMRHGMPSQEEMRRAPPGALGKHQAWEKRNKRKLSLWKNLVLSIHKGSQDPDLANFERFRPVSSTLSMAGAQIEGKQFYFPSQDYVDNFPDSMGPEAEPEPKPDERLVALDLDSIEPEAPEVPEVREPAPEPAPPQVAAPKAGRGWTPERRAEASRKAKARWAAKQAELERTPRVEDVVVRGPEV